MAYVLHSDGATLLLSASTRLMLARKRWHVARYALSFFHALAPLSRNGVKNISIRDSEYPGLEYSPTGFSCDDVGDTSISMAKKRWRFVRVAMYSLRAFVSLVKVDAYGSNVGCSYTIVKISGCSPHHNQVCIDQELLSRMVKDQSLDLHCALGGVHGIANALETTMEAGIQGNDRDLSWRRRVYGSNTYNRPPPKGFFSFVWGALKDMFLIILLVCAVLSLGFGIKQHGPKEGWYDGSSIFVAVFVVVVVTAISNFKQKRQFDKLSKISDNIIIDVVRNGRPQKISIYEVLVGDIVLLKIGDQVPADGLFIDSQSLQMDKSSITGESDLIEVNSKDDPFLHSGSKVADGYGRMMVTSVGMNTSWGEVMSSINHDSDEKTPLQVRLNSVTSSIGKVGIFVALLVLTVLLVRYFTGNTEDEMGNTEYKGSKTGVNSVLSSLVGILGAAVTIVVVAIPEGLPLAVTLTLAYSMKKMMSDQAMVRKLSACETMGSTNVICTDKTGTLTLNQMQVTKFCVGEEEQAFLSKKMKENVLELLQQGVALNTTGSVFMSSPTEKPEILGSPTEKAILSWAVRDLEMNMKKIKQSFLVLRVENFNSVKKRSGVLVRKKSDGTFHVHWKGAAEMVLEMCSSYYRTDGSERELNGDERRRIATVIEAMAACSLRCIAFAHKQVLEQDFELDLDEHTHPNLKEKGLSLLGIVGLKDPCRPEVSKAVQTCKSAGVRIKMITGDNVFTAKAIATECGILDQNSEMGSIVEGAEFRNYTHEERLAKIDKISVMARSTPLDKLLMVKCLKEKGDVVAVTGDGTNDAPALKEADIGLSMGIQGTEVAKESSDIVILDDNFNSVVTVLKWGRCIYNNIQKFIQFQLTVNVAACAINFIAAVSAGEVPLTAVQLLWVNLIMDSLGALALATERPTNELLSRSPVGRSEPLITNVMWRNILTQALYQIGVLLILQFKGESIFNVSKGVNATLIFNTFVLCQVFNEFNSRRLQKKNVFEGIHRNPLFITIVAITVILQVMMVEFMKKFATTERLNVQQWGACIAIAALSWPIGLVVKFIPI